MRLNGGTRLGHIETAVNTAMKSWEIIVEINKPY